MKKVSVLYFLVILAIALILFYHAYQDLAPVTLIVRSFGLISYLLILISLMIGPLARIKPEIFAELIEPRRVIGVLAFVFAFFHGFLVSSIYFNFDFLKISSQLNLLAGQIALLLMTILAFTSLDYAVKKLGVKLWKFIHSFNFFVFILTSYHFLSKSNGLFTALDGNLASINFVELFLVLLGFLILLIRIYDFYLIRFNKKNK
ncbi:MAG: ferric reductase-like transmembrane domain-containing protein [Candidatus Anstonellales archaeon]